MALLREVNSKKNSSTNYNMMSKNYEIIKNRHELVLSARASIFLVFNM